MRRLVVALALVLASTTARAETFYLVDVYNRATLIAASTIRDIGPQRKSAEVHDVGFLDQDVATYEIDCATKQIRDLDHRVYWLHSEMLELTGTKPGADWRPLPDAAAPRAVFAFVCAWPKVDEAVESGDFADDKAMVASLSESILDMPAK
jgi:hypothetical protein